MELLTYVLLIIIAILLFFLLKKERVLGINTEEKKEEINKEENENKKYFTMKPDETIFVPLGAIHRIENPYKKPVKIIEAQVGSILKETDIVRYQDIYGRVK